MSKYSLFFLVSMLCLFGCNKDNDDPAAPADEINTYFTDLADTAVVGSRFDNFNIQYKLDIDQDSIVDLLVTVGTHYSPSYGSWYRMGLFPENDFEIAIDSISWDTFDWNPGMQDTIFYTVTKAIPYSVQLNESIPGSLFFTDGAVYLHEKEVPGAVSMGYVQGYEYGVEASDYVYLALRKETEGFPILAWLKLKYAVEPSYDYGLILNSCFYSDDSFELIIE